MTPTAVTPAARAKRPKATAPTKTTRSAATSGASAPRAPRASKAPARSASPRASSPHPSAPRASHQAPLQRSAAPRAPRRVSGPAARVTRPAVPAPTTAPRVPRRTAPVRTSRPAAAARRTTHAPALPLSTRTIARLRTLPDHSLLDRVVRGRLWIPLLGVLLAGIVATQVEVLKLNASIGHSVVRATALAGDNQVLRARISQLSDAQRIEVAAERYGMQMPATTQPLFLAGAGGSTLTRALRNIHAPNPTSFGAQTIATANTRANLVTQTSGQ